MATRSVPWTFASVNSCLTSSAPWLAPHDARAHYNRGLIYFSLGQFESAIDDFTEAIQIDPELGPAYADRAKAYTQLGKTVEAQQDEAKARELVSSSN